MDNLIFECSDEILDNFVRSGVKNLKIFDGKKHLLPFINPDSKQTILIGVSENDSVQFKDANDENLAIVVPFKDNDNFSRRVFIAHKKGEDAKLDCLEFVVRIKNGNDEYMAFVSATEPTTFGKYRKMSINTLMPENYILSSDPQLYSEFDGIMDKMGYVRKKGIYVKKDIPENLSREELFEQWLDEHSGHVAVDSILMNAWMAGYEAGMRYGEKAK